jgi:hypothetical protein
MDAYQPAKSFREAARDYDGASKLFRQLAGYRDEIAELRRKRASYDTISELLKIDGVNVSWKTVARFCHATLDSGRVRRRQESQKRTWPTSETDSAPSVRDASNGKAVALLKERREAVGPWTPRKRGPRIADSKNL